MPLKRPLLWAPVALAVVLVACWVGSSQAQETKPAEVAEPAKAAEAKPVAVEEVKPKTTAAAPFTTLEQKAAYAIGVYTARNIAEIGIQLDTALIMKGMTDGFAGKDTAITDEEMQQALMAMNRIAQQKEEAKMAAAAETNVGEGADYLTTNAKREGVTTTASGLQYEVLAKGDGPTPKASDTVKVHYTGKLLDGKVFDSSHKRGQPATFPVNRVIAGWTEALQLMSVGDKWLLTIPPNLAYGERGAGGDIGPNATLIFEVELLGIE